MAWLLQTLWVYVSVRLLDSSCKSYNPEKAGEECGRVIKLGSTWVAYWCNGAVGLEGEAHAALIESAFDFMDL